MKEIKFSTTIGTGDLYRFTMRHTYFSLGGVFGLLLSFGSLILAIVNRNNYGKTTVAVLLFVACLFTVIQPIMLYVKCAAQSKRNKGIDGALEYTLSESGIRVTQKEDSVEIPWYEIRKVVYAGKAIYIYLSPVRAFIFPAGQCQGKFEEITGTVRQMVDKYKDYDPEEEMVASEGEERHEQ